LSLLRFTLLFCPKICYHLDKILSQINFVFAKEVKYD